MRARTGLWEPRGGNDPWPPGPTQVTASRQVQRGASPKRTGAEAESPEECPTDEGGALLDSHGIGRQNRGVPDGKDVRATPVHTHVSNRGGRGVRGPADRLQNRPR